MAAAAHAMKAPLALAGLWLATVTLAVLAAVGVMVAVPQWHTERVYLEQLGLWQTWVSIAACVGLLTLSKRKYAETEESWAQGALLIYVLGGLLSAILLNYGVLPRWWVQSTSLAITVQVLALIMLHWCFAWRTLCSLWKCRQHA